MLTTVGTLDPPLGKVRLHVAWLISSVVATNTHFVNCELTELGTVNVLLVSICLARRFFINVFLIVFLMFHIQKPLEYALD